MLHLPPSSHVLESYANSNLHWWKALAELVDNSLDAGATRVVIDVTNRVLTVSDDGSGCEDITALFQLGSHKKRKSGKKTLGRYGIGAKDAWLSCADTMEVVTCRNGIQSSMRVNHLEWIQNNWGVDEPKTEATNKPSGTTIRLPLRHGKNAPSEEAFKNLEFVFIPAIQHGIQILESHGTKKCALRPVEMPMREDVIQSEFSIDGKSVKIDIGILPNGVSIARGPFWVIFGHRIIQTTSLGAGQYSVRRLAGTITIGDGWSLAKNKDDLSENQERLADAIFVRIERILKKADQLSETIESALLKDVLQDTLNSAFYSANKDSKKEKRERGEAIGSVEPKNTGRRRRNASKSQVGPGSVIDNSNDLKSRRKTGYILDWCELDTSILGMFDRSGMRVSLNTNNGIIKASKDTGNRAALTACAVSLIADYCCNHDDKGNKLLRYSFDDFSQAMGCLVKDYTEVQPNGKAAV